MTNESATKVLKRIQYGTTYPVYEAINTAIEALNFVSEHHQSNIETYAHDMGVSLEQAERELRVEELSCSEKPNRSDLISRQSVINVVNDVANCRPYKVVGKRETYSEYNEGWTDGLNRLEANINALPSAQPEPCGDVVSRNAIVQKLNEMDRYVSTELRLCDTDKKFPQNEVFIVDDVYEEIVEQLPSAQPDLSDDGTLMMTVPHGILSDVLRVLVDEVGTKFCKVMYQDEPKRKKEHWIEHE